MKKRHLASNEKQAIVGAYFDLFEEKWTAEELPLKYIGMLDKLSDIISAEDSQDENDGKWTPADAKEKFMWKHLKIEPFDKAMYQFLGCLHQNERLEQDVDSRNHTSRLYKHMILSLEIEEVEKKIVNQWSFAH